MKKTLLLGMLLAVGFGANAQLPNGSMAPDFTATDINGNTHSLYADYLDNGMSVILDISATWCGPCWGYHTTHAMADIYEAYGPDASGEVMVFFVEGDPSTTLLNLQGQLDPSNNNIPTQGDWTAGTPYPIIDSAEIGQLYDAPYFPTVYRICPDGTIFQVDQQNTAQLKSGINTNCGALEGVQNLAHVEATPVTLCEEGTGADVTATLKNYGANAITSATLTLRNYDEVVATQEYTGSAFNQFIEKTVTFENVTFAPNGQWSVKIDNINGGNAAPTEAGYFGVGLAKETPNNFEFRVYTDNYPGEMSWKIKDASGEVVAEGGPYQAGPGAAGAGGPDANTMKMHNITLPGEGCYSVELLDSYGDGWSLGNTQHGVEITDFEGNSLYHMLVGNFGTVVSEDNAIRSTGVLGNEQFESSSFAIYPNPSTGLFNFTTQETVSVTVMDLTGKVVFTAAEINDGGTINLSSLSSGMYVAKVSGASFEKVEKLVIK